MSNKAQWPSNRFDQWSWHRWVRSTPRNRKDLPAHHGRNRVRLVRPGPCCKLQHRPEPSMDIHLADPWTSMESRTCQATKIRRNEKLTKSLYSCDSCAMFLDFLSSDDVTSTTLPTIDSSPQTMLRHVAAISWHWRRFSGPCWCSLVSSSERRWSTPAGATSSQSLELYLPLANGKATW